MKLKGFIKMKILTIFGARPQFIKAEAVSRVISSNWCIGDLSLKKKKPIHQATNNRGDIGDFCE